MVHFGYNPAMPIHCPICQRETCWERNPWRPFCSERCQVRDLGSWASEWYRVPGASLTIPSAPDNSDETA